MARLKNQQYLLENVDVKRWYSSLREDSTLTADGYLRRLDYLARRLKLTPAQMILKHATRKDGDPDLMAAKKLLLDLVTDLKTDKKDASGKVVEKAKTAANVRNYVKTIRSWFSHNNIEVPGRIRLGKAVGTKYSQENVPDAGELRRILDKANRRARFAIAMMAYAGVRPQVLGNHTATDGLKISDFPEMEYRNEEAKIVKGKAEVRTKGTVTFKQIPTMFIVRENVSKMGNQYSGFLSREGCGYLREWLEWRMNSKRVFNGKTRRREWKLGEQIDAETPIFTGEDEPYIGKHIQTISVRGDIRRPIRKAGFGWRPYVLRRFYSTAMMMAEYDKLVIKDWSVFWMGHGGDIESVYRMNKGLPPPLREKMRRAYAAAAEKHLDTLTWREPVTQESVMGLVNRQNLKLLGYTDADIDREGDPAKFSGAKMRELIRRKTDAQKGVVKMVPKKELGKWIEGPGALWKWIGNRDEETSIVEHK